MALNSGIRVDHTAPFLDQPIVEPLMIPLDVVMLRVGIQIGTSRGKLHCLDARGFQDLAKRPPEQRITIVDEVASFLQKPLVAISEIACDLFHPLAIGSRKNPGNFDSTSLEVEDEENEIPNQARPRDHFDTEEVGYRNTRKRCFLPRIEPSGTSPTTSPSSGSGRIRSRAESA